MKANLNTTREITLTLTEKEVRDIVHYLGAIVTPCSMKEMIQMTYGISKKRADDAMEAEWQLFSQLADIVDEMNGEKTFPPS